MFDHKAIEKKWQDYWRDHKTFATNFHASEKFYALDMFPYPSGSGLHVGHVKGYTATDVMARYKRLRGCAVIHPMGWDAFGLPAEQYALKTNNHPALFTQKNIAVFKRQMEQMGFSFDWDLEVNTTDPNYYKTTQWIFAQMFKHGLAELRDIEVNWCQELGTVLANEEVLDGPNGTKISEVGGFVVTKRAMRQWVLNITKYARRLVDELETIAWPESLKNIQRKWIYTTHEDGSVSLHLKDWLFSRQRYWGEPFPVAFDSRTGDAMLIERLPVVLPELRDFKPSGTGESPLALAKEWLEEIPGHRRETNTMPQWAGSCWYYLAYLMKNADGTYVAIDSPEAKARFERWLPVDLYIGGQEHAVLHLMYARFWHKFLYDTGIFPKQQRYWEPFYKIINVGIILGPDGQKMSKSKGNVVSPDMIIEQYGADTLRVYEMFMGPLTASLPWSSEGLEGMRKWLDRVYRLYQRADADFVDENVPELAKAFAKCIHDVQSDLERDSWNTPVSALMIFVNECYKKNKLNRAIMKDFLVLLGIYAPHLADELNQILGGTISVFLASWPSYDSRLLDKQKLTIAVQVNGKFKGTVEADARADKQQVVALAKDLEQVSLAIAKNGLARTVYVPGRLVNFVTN